VDIRIGVTQTPRELEVELADGVDADQLAKDYEQALGNADAGGVFWLTDRRGRRVGVPAAKIAYIEFDSSSDERRVGFGAAFK
jgi:hypothetical protein